MASQRKNDFSQGGIARNILSLAIPLTVAQLTVVLYNVVDRAFIGHIDAVGRDAFTGPVLHRPGARRRQTGFPDHGRQLHAAAPAGGVFDRRILSV